MAYAQKNPLPLAESLSLEKKKGLTNWCMPAILHFVFSYWFSLFSLFLLFLILSFLLLALTHLTSCDSLLVVALTVLLIPPVHGKGPLYITCRDWFFTILAFNYLCLVWVSLPTIAGLSADQPLSLICAGCATSHYQTKKIILFTCSSWHSYLLWCGCSFSPYPSWHAPSSSISSLLLLGSMSSQ